MKWLNVPVKGGLIRGSINLPAQSLYYTIPALYNLFSAAKKTKVIWYCGKYSAFASYGVLIGIPISNLEPTQDQAEVEVLVVRAGLLTT